MGKIKDKRRKISCYKMAAEHSYTVEEAIEHIGFGRFQYKLSLLTGCAWMADAMELMILSIISPQLRCDWQLTTWEEALITMFVFIGMVLSSSMWGNICDTYGRKTGLIMCVALTFYMGFLSSFAPNLIWLLILRGLVGFGVGGVPQSVTLYSEFLPVKSRAICIMLIEVFWALGSCFEVVLALMIMPTLSWRYLLAVSALPLLIFTFACGWTPESPRYQVLSGNSQAAVKTLQRIAKDNGKEIPEGKLICTRQTNRGRIKDLFATPELTKTTIYLWIIWFNCSFSYYGLVLLTTELFQQEIPEGGCLSAGANVDDCNLACKELTTKDYTDLMWTTIAEFPGCLLTIVLIEFLGRKWTMALDFIGFVIFVLCMMLCVSRNVLVFFLFTARAFISGAFQAAYVYTPEVYPTNVRAIGLGSCSGMSRLGAIITPFIAQVMLNINPSIAFIIYGVISILAAFACFMLPIETKGRVMKDSIK